MKRLCAAPAHRHMASCLALARTDVSQPHALVMNAVSPMATPSGYGPTDLRSAYNLPANGGAGATIAIVDAQDDPNAESDLAAYRAQYGLPACTTANGCFSKVDQNGGSSYPTADSGWAGEISLDLDMVSAVAPNAHILLVEATTANMGDLGTSVNTAVSLGAKYVSNSYGGPEDSTDLSSDSQYFNHPGVAITVSAGDSAYGAQYPAGSRYVTSVGGTALSRASNSRGWSESVWNTSSTEGTGSGCSAYDAKPTWQTDSGCSKRTISDVSAVADPATGVAVYDSYQATGWQVYGGTSASSPIIAGVYADAGTPGTSDYPAKYPYQHTSSLNDVTTGNNGSRHRGHRRLAADLRHRLGRQGPQLHRYRPSRRTRHLHHRPDLRHPDHDRNLQRHRHRVLRDGLRQHQLQLDRGLDGHRRRHQRRLRDRHPLRLDHKWQRHGDHFGRPQRRLRAMLGSTGPSNTSTAAQTFTAPTGSTKLSFAYNVTCPDTVTYDWATATLKDNTTGTTTTVLAKTCVASSGWVTKTAAVTAGHSYTLTLTSKDDNYAGDPTYTYYDDVTVS